ncbi:hypothetical protein [Rubripirellula reticaptiva]|nr:hypothetical protein [Rubripirellula reticaptiva]
MSRPNSASNLVCRAESRMQESKPSCQAINGIEYNRDLKTGDLA